MQIDPRQLQRMMKQMGINTEEINAKRVIIEQEDKMIILNNPTVTKIDAKGNISFQIAAEDIQEKELIPEEDIELVAKQANVSKDEARKALEETDGDVAEAIMKLKN
jgi:nascent polypeptide-associated complex subunit alpha